MNKQQLANKIWASANKMRSKIEANEYKDYIIGLIFYKFLSDNEVNYLKSIEKIFLPTAVRTMTCWGMCMNTSSVTLQPMLGKRPESSIRLTRWLS